MSPNEHTMASSGRFAIANLANQDDFRVLAHQGSQAGGMIKPRRRVDLRLGDSFDGDLDRIL